MTSLPVRKRISSRTRNSYHREHKILTLAGSCLSDLEFGFTACSWSNSINLQSSGSSFCDTLISSLLNEGTKSMSKSPLRPWPLVWIAYDNLGFFSEGDLTFLMRWPWSGQSSRGQGLVSILDNASALPCNFPGLYRIAMYGRKGSRKCNHHARKSVALSWNESGHLNDGWSVRSVNSWFNK